MKKILWFIAVLIVIAVGVVVALKLPFGASLKTYTEPHGAFSFSYPIDDVIVMKDGIPFVAATASSSKPYLVVVIVDNPDVTGMLKQAFNGKAPITIGPYTVYKVAINSTDVSLEYIIPLDNGDAPKIFLVVGKYGAIDTGMTVDQIEKLIPSIKVDMSKLQLFLDDQKNRLKAKALDAKIREELSSARISVENYYTRAQGYIGMCNPTASAPNAAGLRTSLATLKTDVGASNFGCFAEKEKYAMSVKLPSNSFYCVDSTGFVGVVSGMIVGPSCK